MAHDQGRSPCSIKQSAVINKKVVPVARPPCVACKQQFRSPLCPSCSLHITGTCASDGAAEREAAEENNQSLFLWISSSRSMEKRWTSERPLVWYQVAPSGVRPSEAVRASEPTGPNKDWHWWRWNSTSSGGQNINIRSAGRPVFNAGRCYLTCSHVVLAGRFRSVPRWRRWRWSSFGLRLYNLKKKLPSIVRNIHWMNKR